MTAKVMSQFEQVARGFAEELRKYDLKPVELQPKRVIGGVVAEVAFWSGSRPRVCISFDRFLNDGDSHFWFGFYSTEPTQIKSLVAELRPKFRLLKITGYSLQDDNLLERKKAREVTKNGGLTYERYDDAFWFGKYDVGFNPASNLAIEAAGFIGDVVTFVDEKDDLDRVVARLKRLGIITTRQDQVVFRNTLRQAYKGKCAVTGCATAKALQAAHIQVKKGVDINHLANGILLRVDIHALFDSGLITLTEDGTHVEVKPELVRGDSTYNFLKEKVIHRPTACDAPSYNKMRRDNIRHHRDRFGFHVEKDN